MRRLALAQALLLLLAAASQAAEHFAPAPQPVKPSRFSSLKVPGVVKKLNPLPVVRGAFGKSKVGLLRRLDGRRLARAGDDVERTFLRQQRWGRDEARDGEADDLMASKLFVAGPSGRQTATSKGDLQKSARTIQGRAGYAHALLPIGIAPENLERLVTLGLDAVEGKTIHGAPEGMEDVLQNRLVARQVVGRTLKGERGWLTATQREVLADLLADGNEKGAATFVDGAWKENLDAALATESSYRLEDLDTRGEIPLVIRAAVAKDPQLAGRLRALEEQGLKLKVRQMIHTPPGVRKAAWEHAAFGEETELGWLNDLVVKGTRPDPRPTRMGIVRAVALGRFSRRHPPTERDLAQRIDLIEEAVRQAVVIEAEGEGADRPEVQDALARVNASLEPVRRAVAKHRIIFDVKHEAGESARELLPMVAALALTATGLQAAGMSEAAILGAEFGEDALQGAVEGAAQDGSGRLKSETWRPGALLGAGAALGGAFWLADPIHKLAHAGQGWAAGPLMGIGSISLSGAVFGGAVSLFKKGRVARLREGKVADTVPALMFDAGFQKRIAAIEKRPKDQRRELLLGDAHARLTGLSAEYGIPAAEIDRTMGALQGAASYEDLRSMVKMPGQGALWKAAFSEAVGTQTRKALGQGMIITVGASTVIGSLGLLDGPAWGMAIATLGSSGEGLWGLYRSHRFEAENEQDLRSSLKVMAGDAPERSILRPSTWFKR